MWEQLSPQFKLNILAGESTVDAALLAENPELGEMIKGHASKEMCLAYINENF